MRFVGHKDNPHLAGAGHEAYHSALVRIFPVRLIQRNPYDEIRFNWNRACLKRLEAKAREITCRWDDIPIATFLYLAEDA